MTSCFLNTKEDIERCYYSIFYPQCFKFYYLDVTYAGFGSLLLLWDCIQYIVGKGSHVVAHQRGRSKLLVLRTCFGYKSVPPA